MIIYKKRFKESDTVSAIGSGIADIYRSDHIDSLSIFKKVKKVFVAKNLEDGIEKSLDKKDVVLVVKGPHDVLWAKPVVDGKLVEGMFSGSFIYSSNGVVMKSYSHPIRLMDRVE
ncbi:MAG: hypothetical protein WC554_10600 [Clostridia bacterium]|jgi:hypothetical protein